MFDERQNCRRCQSCSLHHLRERLNVGLPGEAFQRTCKAAGAQNRAEIAVDAISIVAGQFPAALREALTAAPSPAVRAV